jgi:hypothetical protein
LEPIRVSAGLLLVSGDPEIGLEQDDDQQQRGEYQKAANIHGQLFTPAAL